MMKFVNPVNGDEININVWDVCGGSDGITISWECEPGLNGCRWGAHTINRHPTEGCKFIVRSGGLDKVYGLEFLKAVLQSVADNIIEVVE